MRKAALGDVGRPVNPHAQPLQVAAHKQVRQLTVPKGKAKSKAKAKPKAKAKTKNKNPKPKTEGKKTKTVYGIAKDEYFQMPLGSMRMTASCRPCSHELKNCCTTNQAQGHLRRPQQGGQGVVVDPKQGASPSHYELFGF